MEVDVQAPPPVAKPATRSSRKGKGKGKGRASQASAGGPAPGAVAVAPLARAGAAADNGDSDVDMSDTVDAVAGKNQQAQPQPQPEQQQKKKKQAEVPDLNVVGVLDCIPREPVYLVWPPPSAGAAATGEPGSGRSGGSSSSSSLSAAVVVATELPPLLKALMTMLRSLAVTEWLVGALALLTRWAHSRSAQSSGGQQAASRWGAVLVSGNGRKILERVMRLHRYVLLEVRCVV